MTSEERWIRIENALRTVTEHQAHFSETAELHDKEIAELRELHKGMAIAISKLGEAQRHTDERLNAVIATTAELQELQRHTDGKLNALIDTVDRIVRNGKGGR